MIDVILNEFSGVVQKQSFKLMRSICELTDLAGQFRQKESALSLQKATDIAVGMALTDKEITQISSGKQVYKVEFQECFRCG